MISLRLQQLREQQHKRQVDVAAHLGCSVKTYSRYESGQTVPRLKALIALADYYQVSLDDLCEQENSDGKIAVTVFFVTPKSP